MASPRTSKRPAKRSGDKIPKPRLDPRKESEPPAGAQPRSRAPSRAGANERIAELEAALDRERKERESDESSMGEMLVRIAESDRGKRNAEERTRTLGARLEELEAQLDAAEKARDAAERSLELAAPQPDAEDTAKRIADLEASVRDTESRLHEMTAQRDGFERSALELRTTAASNERASKAAIAAVEADLGTARSELETAATQLRDATAARDAETRAREQAIASRDALETQLDVASERLRTLTGELEATNEKLSTVSARKAELERAIVESASDAHAQTQRANELAAHLLDAQKRIATLEGELALAQSTLEELQKRADAMERELTDRKRDVDHARAARDAIERVADARADSARDVLAILSAMSERDAADAAARATAIASARLRLEPSRESLPPGTRAKGLPRSVSPSARADGDLLPLDDADLVGDEH